MAYNLLREPWLPVRMRSGAVRWLTVSDITMQEPDGDYPVEPAWPRSDFNTPAYEILIGLLAVAMAPDTHAVWRKAWKRPPPKEALSEVFRSLESAFNLDGDGPRFLQEHGGLEGEANPIESLLIDTPGENGQKKNTDLLTHRNRYPALSLPAAAMALYAFQAFAPSGGAGNRTSLRGGGPLSVLVMPQSPDPRQPTSLWQRLWSNVPEDQDPVRDLAKVFPWLAPPQTVKEGVKIHNTNPRVHKLQAFFGMPRRLSLVLSPTPLPCALTGTIGPAVTGFIQKPRGLDYGLWQHPLTPYRRLKADQEWFSIKPKEGRTGYGDWTTIAVEDANDPPLSIPPDNIVLARGERKSTLTQSGNAPDALIRIAGWAMNNMEAITYLVAEEPLHIVGDDTRQRQMGLLAGAAAKAGASVHRSLRSAVREALFSKDDKSADGTLFDTLRHRFYARTHDDFHTILDSFLTSDDAADLATLRLKEQKEWCAILRKAALKLFDETAPVPFDVMKAERVVQARSHLLSALNGYSKSGAELFKLLEMPLPETGIKKTRTTRTKETQP